MKPKWGGISKYIGLDKFFFKETLSLSLLKLHVYLLIGLSFALDDYCTSLFFIVVVSGEVQFSPALNLGKLKYSMASNCSHAYRKHLLIAYLIEKKIGDVVMGLKLWLC